MRATLAREAIADDPAEDPARPPAAGPVFVGGFAFAHEGGALARMVRPAARHASCCRSWRSRGSAARHA